MGVEESVGTGECRKEAADGWWEEGVNAPTEDEKVEGAPVNALPAGIKFSNLNEHLYERNF